MELIEKNRNNYSLNITLKGLLIGFFSLLMLIPGALIQNLIWERQRTRDEAVKKIDAKWSYAQTIGGPVISIPYTTSFETGDGTIKTERHTLSITPDKLNIHTRLFPEERHYGIYKTILYKSTVSMEGSFAPITRELFPEGVIHWDKALLTFGVSDLRGISEEIRFSLNHKTGNVQAAPVQNGLRSESLQAHYDNIEENTILPFHCTIELKGSESIHFLPIGRNTSVTVEGAWKNPGFVGNYTPEYTLNDNGFSAHWQLLHFNRGIPDTWNDRSFIPASDLSFGVSLVDPVDIYQLNLRSSKYAFLFIILTFALFFFVELTNRRRIHPIQYLLVGAALIIFFSLLLSFSETLGFGWAYLISAIATISLLTAYASGIFKDKGRTAALTVVLSALYLFLYVILQLEEVALLTGSIGLFVILGIIMYFSRKISWYQDTAPNKTDIT